MGPLELLKKLIRFFLDRLIIRLMKKRGINFYLESSNARKLTLLCHSNHFQFTHIFLVLKNLLLRYELDGRMISCFNFILKILLKH